MSRALSWTLHAGLFLLVLGVTAFGVRRGAAALGVEELQEVGIMRFKLGFYAERAANYDLLFVGSSRMFRQVDPELFDRTLAERGLALRSYNLGLPGMWFYEVLYRVDWIAAHAPPNLRWLVIELQDADPEVEQGNLLSRRAIAWHSPRITALACRSALAADRPLAERLGTAGGHLVQGAMNALNLGLALSAFGSKTMPSEFRAHKELRGTGFMPLEYDPEELARHEEFARTLAADPSFLARQVESYHAATGPGPDSAPGDELADLVRRLEQRGIQPIFVLLPPSSRARTEIVEACRRAGCSNVIDLEDPQRWPDFYLKVGMRFDPHHLNLRGAEVLTRRLAEACLPILSAPRDPPQRP